MARSLLARTAGLIAGTFFTLAVSAQAMLGAPAPTLSVEALQNTPADRDLSADGVTWDALAGKTVVLEFWATWCGPCIQAIPHLNDLAESYADADDVIFLSVTDEPVELVREFRAKSEMKSWIGHDLDRDMIDSFDVRGIPRTFLIHDGRVMAATHPMRLTREHIETARRGEIVDELSEGRPRFRDDVSNEAGGGATLRWMSGGGEDTPALQPGIDPYTMLEEPPALQVIVRELSAFNIAMWQGPNRVAMLGRPVDEVVSMLWEVDRYAIDLDEALRDRRFDVIVRTTPEQLDLALPLVAAGMGVRVERETVKARGWRATIGENGVLLEAAEMPSSLGHRQYTTATEATLSTESNTAGVLLEAIAAKAGGPVIDETGLGDRLFAYEVSIPLDADAMPEAILEATGIRLEPIETEVEGVVVRPIDR